jgi:hypothetical protein
MRKLAAVQVIDVTGQSPEQIANRVLELWLVTATG